MELTVGMAFCAPAPDSITINIVRGDDRPSEFHAQAVAIVAMFAKYLPAGTWDEILAEMTRKQQEYDNPYFY